MIALVAGALANKRGNGGNAWARLSWTRGLAELGFDTYFVEQLTGPETPGAIAFFEAVIERFGEPTQAALLDRDGELLAGGMTREQLLDVAARSALLVNLSGHLQLAEVRRLVSRCVFVDDDPGYTQFWHAAGLTDGRLDGYDAHYTFGTRIGTGACPIPTGGIRWRGIRPPVVLSDWPAQASSGCERVTTVASWRGPYGPVEYEGSSYGPKAHELRRFADLPRRVGLEPRRAGREPRQRAGPELEIALAIDPPDNADAELLRGHGWTLVEPFACAGDPAAFRGYVQGSDAELSVAQGIYVQTGCGWFSDRTTRYLASGRPAIVQDTGFSAELPVGAGLLAFTTPEEALAAIHEVELDHQEHARAARELAEEHFDSARVLQRMLEEVL